MIKNKKIYIFWGMLVTMLFSYNFCFATSIDKEIKVIEYASNTVENDGGSNSTATKDPSYYVSTFETKFKAKYKSNNANNQKGYDNVLSDIKSAIASHKDKGQIAATVKKSVDNNISDGNLKAGVAVFIESTLDSIGYYTYATEYNENIDFWGHASNWFSGGKINADNLGAAQDVVNIFADMINIIGTAVIVLVTIFLGIKYMYGSVESKTSVKESLISLLIACVFFFGWQSIWGLLFPNGNFIFIDSADTTYENIVGKIFSTATFIAQILAIIAVIYVGVRYIFSGASGKADLKAKSGMFIIGIIMAFATTTFLSYISKIVNEVF